MNNKQAKEKNIFNSLYQAIKSFGTAFPILIGVILLLGLLRIYVSPQFISKVFKGQVFVDTILGSIIGSISAGNPISSYIIGAEFLKDGISLFAVTAFIVAWVTVGIVQLPAEASILGKRFALVRNFLSFILAILVSIVTVTILMVIR